MKAKRRTGGGKAPNAGVAFQAKVAAWIVCHALANRPLRSIFGGLVTAIPTRIRHELESGVDDTFVKLEPKGRLYLQVTTAPSVAKVKSFLEQAVSTWLMSQSGGSEEEYAPRLEKAHDALVLVVPKNAVARVRHLHEACRQFDEVSLWPDAGVRSLNNQQKTELDVAKTIIGTAYTNVLGSPPSDNLLVELLGMIRVVELDVDDGGTDQNDALNLLRTVVLSDPEQAHSAWNYLVINIQDAMKRGRGADRAGIAASVAKQGIKLKLPTASHAKTTTDALLESTSAFHPTPPLRSREEDAVLGNHAKAELERVLRRARQRANFLHGDEYQEEITIIARRCVEGDLVRAPVPLRFEAVVFAARAAARQPAGADAAEKLLEQALQIQPDGPVKLAQTTLLGLTDIDAAMVACRKIDTPQARSQLFAFVANSKGRDAALDWLKEAKLQSKDFNGVGSANICGAAIYVGDMDFAFDWILGATEDQTKEAPSLLLLRGQLQLASTVPPDQRLEIVQGLPQDLTTIVFAQTPSAISTRAAALADFRTFRECVKDLDLTDVEALADEYVLWLELVDPATREAAKERLTSDLRNPKLVIERARLGIAFNVPFDRKGLQEELTRRRNIGGWTAQEASTALQLAMTYGDYTKLLEFIDKNRAELDRAKCFSPGVVTSIEIEALARSGAVERAKNSLEENAAELPERVTNMLTQIIDELSGQIDEVESAKIRFGETNSTEHLRSYCDVLWRKNQFSSLGIPASELARRTQNAIDLTNALRIFNKLGLWRETLALADSLPDLEPNKEDILLARAEAYFRVGDVGAARKILNEHFKDSTDPHIVNLDIFLSMESGEWGHIQGIIDHILEATEKYSAIELARLARLARDVGSSHWRELMEAALTRASDDPNVYLAAYTLATEHGEEDQDAAQVWMSKAIELSGENGPVQRKSLQDIADTVPEWRKREDFVNTQVRSGTAPLFIAARSLNMTIINASLGRGLRNLKTPDASRRSSIFAFDGSHRQVDLSNVKTMALDLSSLFTLGLLDLTATAIGAFSQIVIGSGTLTLLFQERQRIKFHQPSRVAKAKRLKALMEKGALKVLEPPPSLPSDLVSEVGSDLAAMLLKAREIGGIVVRPGPLHKAGSFMDTPADVEEWKAQITDSRKVLQFLKKQGAIAASLEQTAMAYINRVDAGMPDAQVVSTDRPLFLDELAISYLEYTSTLEPLMQVVGTSFISKSTANDVEELLTYEEHAEELLKLVDGLAAQLAAGIKKGDVRINERSKPIEDDDDIKQSPSIALLQSTTAFDAIVVDDRALNYLPRWDVPGGPAMVATTVDLLAFLSSAGRIDPSSHAEALRKLRTANFHLISIGETELTQLLANASTADGEVIETQELMAIRENLLTVLANQTILSRDEPWVVGCRVAFMKAFRELWKGEIDDASAKAGWLLASFPSIAKFAPKPLNSQVWSNIQSQRAAEIAFLVNGMQVPDEHRPAFFTWVKDTILDPLLENDPVLFELVMRFIKTLMEGVADGSVE